MSDGIDFREFEKYIYLIWSFVNNPQPFSSELNFRCPGCGNKNALFLANSREGNTFVFSNEKTLMQFCGTFVNHGNIVCNKCAQFDFCERCFRIGNIYKLPKRYIETECTSCLKYIDVGLEREDVNKIIEGIKIMSGKYSMVCLYCMSFYADLKKKKRIVVCNRCNKNMYMGYDDFVTCPPRNAFQKKYLCYECHSDEKFFRREKARVKSQNRRASSFGLIGNLDVSQWVEKLKAYKFKCVYCGDDFSEMDHVIPISRFGPTTINNVVPCCKKCNVRKKDRILLSPPKAPIYA